MPENDNRRPLDARRESPPSRLPQKVAGERDAVTLDLAELDPVELRSRIVAAQEEIEIGETTCAYSILDDLLHDVSMLWRAA